jgi:hypothetical protein
MEARLEGTSYSDAYRSFSVAMEDAVESFRGPIWTPPTLAYFHQMAYYIRAWLAACQRIRG